jgi:hypothetical protein
MSKLEGRIRRLEERLPDTYHYPALIVVPQPWCGAGGAHSLPHGYLRGYSVHGAGYVERRAKETEEQLTVRAVELAKSRRGPGQRPGFLTEDREKVRCTECSPNAGVGYALH